MSDDSIDGRLERAREHCFVAGVGDVGTALCEANVPFGLAKIHHAQIELGLPPDATFVGAPDATTTRNPRRWRQGFGYGGVYSWTGEFAVLDIKPNACGMSVGALSELPPLDHVRERLRAFDAEGLTLDGVPLDNDLTESNHFVDLLEVTAEHADEPALDGARYFYVMHSSGHEHRDASERGPGLYWDQSETLRAMARQIDTPWGSLHVLTGDAAAEWYDYYRKVQAFNHRRRAALGEFLFGPHRVMINATHQGLVRGINRANVGCYTFEDGDVAARGSNGVRGADIDVPDHAGLLFPLTLSPELPVFLVRPARNVGEAAIDALGWRERIERHGLDGRIAGTNLLPHGGGYSYPQLAGVSRVVERGPDDRVFELVPADGGDRIEIEIPRGLPYGYRGMEIVDRMESLALGEIAVELDLRYVLTA